MNADLDATQVWVESSPRLRPFGVFQVITNALKDAKIYHKEIFVKADGNIVIVPHPVHQYEDNYWHEMEAKKEESIRRHLDSKLQQGVSVQSAIGDITSVFYVTEDFVRKIAQDIIEGVQNL